MRIYIKAFWNENLDSQLILNSILIENFFNKMLTRLPGKITADIHTNKIGDFKTPMHFGRVLPPNYNPHGMGVIEPPYEGLRGHITQIQDKIA